MKEGDAPKNGKFEFKIDGEQLYAPRESMSAAGTYQYRPGSESS